MSRLQHNAGLVSSRYDVDKTTLLIDSVLPKENFCVNTKYTNVSFTTEYLLTRTFCVLRGMVSIITARSKTVSAAGLLGRCDSWCVARSR